MLSFFLQDNIMWNYTPGNKYKYECLFLNVKPISIILLYDEKFNILEIRHKKYDLVVIREFTSAKKQHLRKFIKYIFTAEIGEI